MLRDSGAIVLIAQFGEDFVKRIRIVGLLADELFGRGFLVHELKGLRRHMGLARAGRFLCQSTYFASFVTSI